MTRAHVSLLLLGLGLPALGDVAFTNLGPGDSFHPVDPYDVYWNQSVAKSFVSTLSGNLTTIRLPIGRFVALIPGPAGPVLVITLRAPGPLPIGTVLESWVLNPTDVPPDAASLVTLTSSVKPLLSAGTQYWLRVESPIPDTGYVWAANSTLEQGVVTSPDSLIWSDFPFRSPAFEVNVSDGLALRAFQVRYVANLNAVDSLINMTNTGANGAMPFGPGIGPQAGNICANVYAFSADEQMVGCCSCHITPNGLASLSVYNDIRAVTLTGLTPNSMMIKLVATATGGTPAAPSYSGGTSACAQSAAGLNITHPVAADGLAAWTTTGHVPGLFPVPAAPPPFDITETAFTLARLSNQEITSLNNRCTAIIGNGSTFGTCRSCSVGGRGGAKF